MPPSDMIAAEAEGLLARCAAVYWPFPSSSGRPIRPEHQDWDAVCELVEGRERIEEAARWFLENDRDRAYDLAAAAWRVWMVARDLDGGRAFLATVIESGRAPATPGAAMTFYADALFALWLGDTEGSRRSSASALGLAEASGDLGARALAHLAVSRAMLEGVDASGARRHAYEALRLARESGVPALDQAPTHMCAQAVRREGDLDLAARFFRESLELSRRVGDSGMVTAELENLARVEIRRGHVDAAENCFAELGPPEPTDDPFVTVMVELDAGMLAAARGRMDEARPHLERIDLVIRDSGLTLPSDDRGEVEWLRARINAAGIG